MYVDDEESTTGGSDSLPLYPASTEFFGTFSNGGHIINCASSTNNILVRSSDGKTANITLNQLGGISGEPSGFSAAVTMTSLWSITVCNTSAPGRINRLK